MALIMKEMLSTMGTFHLNKGNVYILMVQNLKQMGIILTPFLLTILVTGIGAELFQTRFLFTTDPLVPKFSRVNPLQGLKKLFSINSLVELVKSTLKMGIIGGIAFLIIKREAVNIPPIMHIGIESLIVFTATVSFKIIFYPCLALLFLAVADYGFQRWQYEKNLRMTKGESKEEFKQREGDPLIKGRIKKIQVEMARRRMMEAVKKADVIITNPTTLAIALRYDAEKMMAPKVIAKGAGFIAERIKSIATENRVPIVENKPLARALFKAVDIGEFIPASFYRAVAEILAYIYRLKEYRKH
jgi:flagellar biosynthesis protein FlhB